MECEGEGSSAAVDDFSIFLLPQNAKKLLLSFFLQFFRLIRPDHFISCELRGAPSAQLSIQFRKDARGAGTRS